MRILRASHHIANIDFIVILLIASLEGPASSTALISATLSCEAYVSCRNAQTYSRAWMFTHFGLALTESKPLLANASMSLHSCSSSHTLATRGLGDLDLDFDVSSPPAD